MEPSDKIVLQKDANRYTFELKDVDLKQAGPITVKATNEVGTLSASAKLIVNELPQVDIELEDGEGDQKAAGQLLLITFDTNITTSYQ